MNHEKIINVKTPTFSIEPIQHVKWYKILGRKSDNNTIRLKLINCAEHSHVLIYQNIFNYNIY